MDIKELRNKLKLTQTQFAKRLGLTLSTIQKYESGERKVPNTVNRLIAYEFADDSNNSGKIFKNSLEDYSEDEIIGYIYKNLKTFENNVTYQMFKENLVAKEVRIEISKREKEIREKLEEYEKRIQELKN